MTDEKVMSTYWKNSLRYNGIPGSWRSVHWWGNALYPLHEKWMRVSVSDLIIDFFFFFLYHVTASELSKINDLIAKLCFLVRILLLKWKPSESFIWMNSNYILHWEFFFNCFIMKRILSEYVEYFNFSVVILPFWSISKCSQRMSPTKSGAKSKKRSFPIAHRLAPFMTNLSKSTFFRLNSFTVHVSHSATWFSVHCLGSENDLFAYLISSKN